MKWLPAGMLAVLGLLLVAAPLAAVTDVPGERAIKELVGVNPDGCEVVDSGPDDGWRSEPDMPSLRDGPAAAVVGDHVYLLAGIGSFTEDFARARSVATFERLDLGTGQWERLPDLPRALNHVALAAAGTTLYAFGGNTEFLSQGAATAEAWRFDIAQGRWEAIEPMPTARGGAGVATVGGRIYVVGGRTRGPASLGAAESYDVATGRWSEHAAMPTRRDHLGVAAAGGRLYAVGGRKEDDASMRTLEVYDPRTDRWSRGPDMPQPKAGFAFLEGAGGLVAAGGEDISRWTLYGGVFRYHPARDAWETLPSMPEPRHGFGGVMVRDRMYVFGGSRCSGFLPVQDSSSVRIG